LLYGIKGLFAGRRHFEKLLRLSAGIFVAPSAVDNAFTMRAIPYLANAAIAYVPAVSNTAVTVNVLGLDLVVVFFSPFLSNFPPQFIVVLLRGCVSITVRASQPAISYQFFHFCPPLSSVFYFLSVFLRITLALILLAVPHPFNEVFIEDQALTGGKQDIIVEP
jgi:hypothetical protein